MRTKWPIRPEAKLDYQPVERAAEIEPSRYTATLLIAFFFLCRWTCEKREKNMLACTQIVMGCLVVLLFVVYLM